jgi:hypothetical protein
VTVFYLLQRALNIGSGHAPSTPVLSAGESCIAAMYLANVHSAAVLPWEREFMTNHDPLQSLYCIYFCDLDPWEVIKRHGCGDTGPK